LVTIGVQRSIDLIFVVDSSGSLATTDPMNLRISAMKQLIETIPNDAGVRVGLVDFDSDSFIVLPPTTDISLVPWFIDQCKGNCFDKTGGTDIEAGILEALKAFAASPRADADKMIILFSDGESNSGTDPIGAALKALAQGVTIHSAFLGGEGAPGVETMQWIAWGTCGVFGRAQSPEEIESVFAELSSAALIQSIEIKTSADSIFSKRAELRASFWRGFGIPILQEAGQPTTITATATTKEQTPRSLKDEITIFFKASSSLPPPAVSKIADQSTREDSATPPIPFTVADVETPATNLVVIAVSSNPAVLPNEGIKLGGTGTERTLIATPAHDESGNTTITVTVTDGDGASASSSFELIVQPVNDPPLFIKGIDQVVDENSGTHTISNWATNASSGPANEAGQTLAFQVINSNNGLFSAQPTVSPTGALTFTPVSNATGVVTNTVVLQDDGGTDNSGIDTSAPQTFTITIIPRNRCPIISQIEDQTSLEDTPMEPISFTVGDAETPAEKLILSASSWNERLIPATNIVIGGSGANRTVTVGPARDQFGEGTILVTVADGGGCTTGQLFKLTITPVNHPPTVSLTRPANGETFSAPTNITLTSVADDTDGTVAKVEFFQDATKLGEVTNTPYSLVWSNVPAGNYTLTAKATDSLSANATSAPVSIKVTNPSVNQRPTVVITSPTDGEVFAVGADLAINASATDSGGTVTNVEFFAGNVSLGSAAASPFSVIWKNVAPGDYVLTAQATDNGGLSNTSLPVRVSVTDLTGDVAIVRAVDDAEVAQLKADVLEMGLTPVLFARDPVSANALKNFQLVIFDDQGNAAHKLSATEVDALGDTFAAGIPVLWIGENLASSDDNLDATHKARWSALTHLQRASGKATVTQIDVPDSQDLHPFFNGTWGKPAAFTYADPLDNARLAAGSEAILNAGQADLFVISPPLSAVDDGSARAVAQNFLLTGHGDDAADLARKQLFQNTVCWLLRICPTCSAGHAAFLRLNTELSSDHVNVGDVVTNTVTLALNGECGGNGVMVTNQLPANLRFVSATTPQGTWRERDGVVIFFLGDVPASGMVEMTVVATAAMPGTAGIPSCGRMNRVNFVAADNCADATIEITGRVAPQLIIRALPAAQYELRLSGQTGLNYEIQSSRNLIEWAHFTNALGAKWSVTLPGPAEAAESSFFYRAAVGR
jgi:uncharacterized repeat protein (TIGR01451 family)